MRLGRLPERIYTRSVERIIHKYNKDKGAVRRTNCALLCVSEGNLGSDDRLWEYELAMIVDVAVSRGLLSGKDMAVARRPVAMQAILHISDGTDEPKLRQIMELIVGQAERYDCGIDEVRVSTSTNITNPQITIIMTGEDIRLSHSDSDTGNRTVTRSIGNNENLSIVMTGYAADEGASYLARRYKDKLVGRYSEDYIRRIISKENQISVIEEGISDTYDMILAGYPVDEGGIFASLWDMSEELNCGIRVDIKKIPIRQEAVEMCTFLDINPYELISTGCFMWITSEPERLVQCFVEHNIEAMCIGYLTSDHDRVIINNDEKRYLTEPEMDSIYCALQ